MYRSLRSTIQYILKWRNAHHTTKRQHECHQYCTSIYIYTFNNQQTTPLLTNDALRKSIIWHSLSFEDRNRRRRDTMIATGVKYIAWLTNHTNIYIYRSPPLHKFVTVIILGGQQIQQVGWHNQTSSSLSSTYQVIIIVSSYVATLSYI